MTAELIVLALVCFAALTAFGCSIIATLRIAYLAWKGYHETRSNPPSSR